jgi:hypothetical protein
MSAHVELTPAELALIVEALQDAAFYRDARSHVLKSAARRQNRRSATAPEPSAADASTDIHRRQAKAYEALALKLKQKR